VADALLLRAGPEPSRSTAALADLATDHYMRFTQESNDAAIALYERGLLQTPDDPALHAGLANALVQRVIRYPAHTVGETGLTEALERGLHREPQARLILDRAAALAQRSVRLAPRDAQALKSLGFVRSAQGDLAGARTAYERAIAVDADAWVPLVNLGELHAIEGDRATALAYFERAYEVMERRYREEPQRIGLWLAELGMLIAEEYRQVDDVDSARHWTERVLDFHPGYRAAAQMLTRLEAAGG
jgi:Flp pilus assembly protein TadD